MTVPGTYQGGVCSLETLRGRCVIDADCGCWHLRSACGRVLPQGPKLIPKVHVSGRGRVSARRAAIELRNGDLLPSGLVVAACRVAFDCVNPEHLRPMHHKALASRLRAQGKTRSVAKLAALRLSAAKRRILSDELRQWIRDSSQTQVEIAHAMDISQPRVSDIRRELRALPGSSVFSLGSR